MNRSCILLSFVVGATAAFGQPGKGADTVSGPAPSRRVVRVGESQVLKFHWVSKVVVGNSAVADVVPVSDDEVVLNGKAAGETNLLVWDRTGCSEYRVAVTGADRPAAPDLAAIAVTVRGEMGKLPVEINAMGDTLFLTGEVATAEEKALAGAIAAAHQVKVRNFIRVADAPKASQSPAEVVTTLNRIFAGSAVAARAVDEHTVVLEGNATGDAAEQMRRVAQSLGGTVTVVCYFHPASPRMRQVLVRTRVLEIQKSRTRNLGIDWGSISRGQNNSISIAPPFLFGQGGVGKGLGQLNSIGATVTALEQQNAARVLSEPNLLVMEGNKGSVLIGGEIPVPIAQASGNGTTVTVQYKPFGITLDVDVLGISEEGISLHIRPEVSSLDTADGVQVSGFMIPALRTRRAESVVRIRPGESLAIGGLVENDVSRQTKAIPLLSKIPVLGELFKSHSFQKGETELVILVTPEVKEER
jgi:pilus assembly protein CpaC